MSAILKFSELINAGHKVAWEAMIWNKGYVFMKDTQGTLYLIRFQEDGTVKVLL